MRSPIQSHQFSNADGCPEGGHTFGQGFAIAWQRGPLGSVGSDNRQPANGAFVEDIIAAALDRLEFYQKSRFKCVENQSAIGHLQIALEVLDARTQRRTKAGTEGTWQGK